MTTYDDTSAPGLAPLDDTSLEAMLDDWLDGAANELDPPADQEQADRLLGALRRVRRRRVDLQTLVQARFDQLRAFLADADGPLANREAHLEGLLEGWAQATHEATGRKTWKLPAGDLKVRPRMVTCEWLGGVEEQATVARLVPEAIKTEERVLPGEVKSRATAGDRWPEHDNLAPEGRLAYYAKVGDEVVPGVVLFVPAKGRAGKAFTAVTK